MVGTHRKRRVLTGFAKASAIQTLLTEQQGQCLIQGQIDLRKLVEKRLSASPVWLAAVTIFVDASSTSRRARFWCAASGAFQGGHLRYEMSTDKIGDLDRALAEIFSVRELSSIEANSDLPDFDHEALAEMFHEPLPISAGTEQSPSRFDHRALVEIFGEPPSAVPGPPALSIDEEPSPPLFRKPDHGKPAASVVAVTPSSTSTENVRPQRAESLLAVMRNIFTTRAEPPAPSPQESSPTSSPSGQLHTQPAAEAIAVASSADAERAPSQGLEEPQAHPLRSLEREYIGSRAADQPGYVAAASESSISENPQRAEPPSVETAELVATNPQPIAAVLGNEASPPTTAGHPDGADPSATVVPTTRSGQESEQQTGMLTTEPCPLDLPGSIPEPPLGEARSRDETADRLDDAGQAADTGPTEPESVAAGSNPTDTLPMNPFEMVTFFPVQESDTLREEIAIGQPDDAEAAAVAVAAPLAEVESARPPSAPGKLPLNISADSNSPSSILGRDMLRRGQLDDPGPSSPVVTQDKAMLLREQPRWSSDVPTPPVISELRPAPLSSQPDTVALVAEIAAAVLSGETDSAGRERRVPLPPPVQPSQSDLSTSASRDLANPAPAAKPAPAAPRIHVMATQPHQATSMQLKASPPKASPDPHSFPDLDEDRWSRSLGTRLAAVEPIIKPSSVRLSIVTGPPSQALPLPAEKHLTASRALKSQASVEDGSQRASLTDRLGEACASETAVSPAPTTLPAETPALQVQSLLTEMDLDSAIRLRWVMRDIRANRLGMSPASANDLATLVALGLVEMRGELASLTTLGARELTEL